MTEQAALPKHFFFCVFLCLVLGVAYNTITNMAGLYIVSELGGSHLISVYAMVFYGLGNVCSIPLAQPLSERIGTIKLLVYGLILYAIFSSLCSIAYTFVGFNIFRFGLGLAAGLFFILCRQLLLSFAPQNKIAKYLFMMSLSFSIVPVIGASFGAWLAYESLWRWIFHVNTPIAMILGAYFWFLFRHLDSIKKDPKPIDLIGYLFFALGIIAFVTVVSLAQQLDWYRSTLLLVLATIAMISLSFFIIWELLHPHPIIDIKLLRNPLLSYALLNLAVLFATYFGMIILISLWLNIYVNYTPLWIALLIGTMGLAGIIAYLISKSLLRFADSRCTLALAIIAFASSCYYSTYFDVQVDFFHLAVARFLSGLGLVLFLLPILNLAYASYDTSHSSTIFCLIQMTRSLFSSLGAAGFVILWQRRQVFFHERLAEGLTVYSQLTDNFLARAVKRFYLTPDQSVAQLNVFLDEQSTSLGLNDAFACMGYILLALFVLLLLSFLSKKIQLLIRGR